MKQTTPGSPKHNGNPDKAVLSKEKFGDGSQVLGLESGAMLLMETKSPTISIAGAQPAPYNKPAPGPNPYPV